MTTGEGGVVVTDDPAVKERIDSERNQGRAPDMGWLDHDRLGFNYRLTDIACAIGLVQLERLDGMLRRPRARRLALPRGARRPRASSRSTTTARGSSTSSGCRADVDRDDTIRALRDNGIPAKPYLPAIHLYSFYRERFGFREGMFPVAEDVAARSLALPFFPQMTEGQVAQVAEALGQVLSEVGDEARAADRGGDPVVRRAALAVALEAVALVERLRAGVLQPGVERDAAQPALAGLRARRPRAARWRRRLPARSAATASASTYSDRARRDRHHLRRTRAGGAGRRASARRGSRGSETDEEAPRQRVAVLGREGDDHAGDRRRPRTATRHWSCAAVWPRLGQTASSIRSARSRDPAKAS